MPTVEQSCFRISAAAKNNRPHSEDRLEYVGPALEKVGEVEVSLDRLLWIKSKWPEAGHGLDRLQLRWPESASRSLTVLLAYHVSINDESGPDSLNFDIPPGLVSAAGLSAAAQKRLDFTGANWVTNTIFHPIPGGVGCVLGECAFRFSANQIGIIEINGENEDSVSNSRTVTITDLESLHETLWSRNQALGYNLPPLLGSPDTEKPRQTVAFSVHTGQEWTAFIQTAADGRSLKHFKNNEQSGTLRHQRPNAPFWTETALTDDERNAGHGIELLQSAAAELDLDDGLAWLYISHLLAPPAPLPANAYAGGWVDLDDVARKTMGGYARNPQEAIERRRKIWHAIRYGARTHIAGRRTVPYFDRATGQQIETEIHTTPWQIMKEQTPVQPSLFPENDDAVPVRVELVASREWTALTTSAETAQYLPLGEILGSIPPSQASGAWARALGMAYFQWCRCNVQKALNGDPPPPREWLLEQFPSKKTDFRTVLQGTNPQRALEYWNGAEIHLGEGGIIITNVLSPSPSRRKGWQEIWLAEAPRWKPGPLLCPILENLSNRQMPLRPQSFAPLKRRRGRPRKNPTE